MIELTRRNFGIALGMASAVALTAGALISLTAAASPAVTPGDQAPAFTGVTSTGASISLSDFAGQTVVLEWTNDGCPFVQKHYAEPPRNMQTLMETAASDEVVWIQVISSAPGKQGHVDGEGARHLNQERGAEPGYTLLDPDGVVGRAYGAKTTPHMFVISPEQAVAYAGAIDSVRSARVEDIEGATNYVSLALNSVLSGEPAEIASTVPYGCSVKY